jgi:hypothetical protein
MRPQSPFVQVRSLLVQRYDMHCTMWCRWQQAPALWQFLTFHTRMEVTKLHNARIARIHNAGLVISNSRLVIRNARLVICNASLVLHHVKMTAFVSSIIKLISFIHYTEKICVPHYICKCFLISTIYCSFLGECFTVQFSWTLSWWWL